MLFNKCRQLYRQRTGKPGAPEKPLSPFRGIIPITPPASPCGQKETQVPKYYSCRWVSFTLAVEVYLYYQMFMEKISWPSFQEILGCPEENRSETNVHPQPPAGNLSGMIHIKICLQEVLEDQENQEDHRCLVVPETHTQTHTHIHSMVRHPDNELVYCEIQETLRGKKTYFSPIASWDTWRTSWAIISIDTLIWRRD